MLAAAQVKPGRILDPGEQAHLPRFPEHATATEDEDIGASEHGVRLAADLVSRPQAPRTLDTASP
jgi:hypothetical protein